MRTLLLSGAHHITGFWRLKKVKKRMAFPGGVNGAMSKRSFALRLPWETFSSRQNRGTYYTKGDASCTMRGSTSYHRAVSSVVIAYAGGRVLHHPERKQAYTIWFEGQVERFTSTYEEAVIYCQKRGLIHGSNLR